MIWTWFFEMFDVKELKRDQSECENPFAYW